MFEKILRSLYMILFIVFIPIGLWTLFVIVSKEFGFVIGLFSFLYLILVSIQYLKFGFFNPLKLFEIKKDES